MSMGNGKREESVVGLATMFSVELRRRRHEAGMSLADLGAATHYSKGYLSKVETGRKPANTDLARRCDAVLNAGGALAALVTSDASAAPVGHSGSDGEVWMMGLEPEGGGRLFALNRRQAIAASAMSLLQWPIGSTSMEALDDDVARQFGVLFQTIRALGRMLSPSAVLPLVIAQTHSLRACAARSAGADRQRLLMLGGRHAEYAAWMAQESGDDRAAMWWLDVAVDLATAAEDDELLAYSWVRRAGILLYRNDGLAVVDLCGRVNGHKPSPRVRALAAQREAQGHALAGNGTGCRRALDRAATLQAQVGSGGTGTPPLGSASVPDQLSLVDAWCMFDLGDTRSSAALLDDAAGTIPATAKRAAARFGARRALAHAASGEVDRACVVAHRAVDAAAATDSATVRHDLRRLARTLGRWHTHPAVRALQPDLTAASRG
jgi:hypothetical protein